VPHLTFSLSTLSSATSWGSVPEWLAAAGTILAFSFAVGVYAHDLKVRRDSDRQAQARLFDGWISSSSWEPHVPDDQDPTDGGPTELLIEVHIQNASTQNMRRVKGTLFFGKTQLKPSVSYGDVPPTTPEQRKMQPNWFPPQCDLELGVPSKLLKDKLKLSLSFTDASGNRWHRTENGELRFLHNLADIKKAKGPPLGPTT
jgi:hypothetical protein